MVAVNNQKKKVAGTDTNLKPKSLHLQKQHTMAGTYTQIRIHLIFSPKGRKSLILKKHKTEVEKYITGVIQNQGHKLLAINCMPDHIHIFIGQSPKQSISLLVEKVKKSSRTYIKEQSWMTFDFNWQRGYGAFSHSKSQTDAVVKYILNQEEHHKKKTFRDEYLDVLRNFEIEFEERYVFEFY